VTRSLGLTLLFYRNKGADVDINTGISLLSLADLLELPRLRELTEKKTLCKARVENCATLYHIAMLHRYVCVVRGGRLRV
jgi:hypothetical protein